MTHLGMRKDWLDVVAEGAEVEHDGFLIECDGVDEDFIVLPCLHGIISEAKTKEGWGRDDILKEIDPRFINHDQHLDKLLYGGVRPDGTPFQGGGGLRWGGLVIKGGEGLLRVMGSLEYGDDQKIYQQTIRFANFGKIARRKDATWPEKARLLVKDQLRVHCECPAFRYYYAYTAHKKGFGLYPEVRPSGMTNPHRRGGICKHLHVTLRWLGGQSQKMAGEMKAYFDRGR